MIQEGYTYIENGIPVISTERKPKRKKYNDWRDGNPDLIAINDGRLETALKEFKDNLIPVKNVTWSNKRFPPDVRFLRIANKDGNSYRGVRKTTPGQKVQHNEGEINKIL